MSKQEATRLADALDDSFCPMCHQAAALLRRWPEAGEPVEDDRAVVYDERTPERKPRRTRRSTA